MKIHTDKLEAVIGAVFATTAKLPGVYAGVTRRGSRSRKGALELRLEGNGGHRNSGQYGADTYEQAATWDEWGVVLYEIFKVDPNAFAGSARHPVYADAAHFDLITQSRFVYGLPEDTHKRHNWKPGPILRTSNCNKCSAARDFNAGMTYLEYWKAA